MTTNNLTPASKAELKSAITFDGHRYNYFEGDIRNGSRYARIYYIFTPNRIQIQVTYWQDGKERAVEPASYCSTPAGVTNKVAKFLNLK